MNTIYLILKSKLFTMLLFVLCIDVIICASGNEKINEKIKNKIVQIAGVAMFITLILLFQ